MRLTALRLTLTLFAAAALPLSAATYVQVLGSSNYSYFGYAGYPSSSSFPSPAPASPAPPSTATAQTSSCLYNACGGSAPGAVATTNVTTTFAPTNNVYGYNPAFSGVVSRYSVFGMYNFSPGAFGSTQQPVFAGGLTPGHFSSDPLANPEPTSIALFGAGLLALGWAHRRRKNRQV